MEGPNQYVVFFECPSLDGEQQKRIEKYFQIRRKSGGGECGPITNVRDRLYSVAFNERDAQLRVLQRCEHVLEFADGPLVLTVQESPGPSTRLPITPSTTSKPASPKLDLTSPQQIQQPSLTSSLLTSGEEYELRPDPYLLRHLKECPKAVKELGKALASVACSAQLDPEEGRVLLSCLAQPGAAREDRNWNWKAEVDKVFDGYLCHYEVDPHKVKALLQSCSSRQSADEVRVYSEAGMAVVVGERSKVNARLMDVGDPHFKRGARLSEKQTSVRRLGEAKLRLLWKEFEHSLRQDIPGVKVAKGAAGQLDLEGSAEEILKAGDWISDKERLVLERTVSDKSPHLLAFLRKAYGGPGVLGDFLGVGDKVEVELRDTVLRFFSLSIDDLDKTEKALRGEIMEVKIDIPNCSAVPSVLREKLKLKTNEMNQGKYRAQVVFSSDSTVFLLGHTKEVEELSETVTEFILDQASIEGKVTLPYPELVQLLPELLQLHMFDYSGVTFHPLTSSPLPMVGLEGPSGKVTEVRNRLGLFLDSLVQVSVTIDLPGAVRYFESPSGRENILSVAHSQKCLVQLQEQTHATKQTLASVATYSLRDGFQVLVCEGDITKLDADALVNAANEDLDHGGGVAAALSKAGGPEVQKESRALVKQIGKVPLGEVVVTTGGNLNCKKLLHAVGPVGGKSGGNEREILEKTVQSALNLAEMLEFRSIAIPCISSGVFGVPVTVCSEAIVTAVKKFGSQGGRCLNRVTLIDKRGKVVKAMQEACDRLLRGISTENSAPRDLRSQRGAGAPDNSVHVEVIRGTIETQQVDVLVSPMVGHDPLSTRVGNALLGIVGPQLSTKFHKDAGGATLPGELVVVLGLPALQSQEVLFPNLVPWDNSQHGTAVQVLRQGIRNILASCQSRGYSSVAFPVLGTGVALRFPHSVASRVILEELLAFEQNRVSIASFLVRIVIHPNDKESSKAFQSAQDILHLRGFTNDANPDQASFYRHVSLTNDEVTAMLGGVQLQMVRADIVQESTDVIINTTDFSKNHSGVSKAILTAAGPGVQAELAQVGLPPNLMCTTGPGLLGCREIIHASFKADPQLIRKNCKEILKQCETKGYGSAAFPAINTGVAGMDYVKACKAMLDGMTSAITDLKPKSLTVIRIVILQQPVFQAFRSELENRFGQTAARHLSLREKAKQMLKRCNNNSKSAATSTPHGKNFTSSKPPPAVLSVISRSPEAIRTVKTELDGILYKQLVEREVEVHHLSRLDVMEVEALQANVKVLGISLALVKRQGVNADGAAARAEARGRSGAGEAREVYMLKGLKEDVLSIVELVNKVVQKSLCGDLRDKEEAMLALNVQWSIQDGNACWHELSLHDNCKLEEAHVKKQVSVDLVAPGGKEVTVNLTAQEATDWLTGITFKVKRSESDATIELPTVWEPMNGEDFKKIALQPSSPEYQTVATGFLKTAKGNIQKIERVQNLYLWHAYTVCRQRMIAKNGLAELREENLYHGTSVESCNCIERDRFNRSYAGAHAAAYGKGVYFAVNAEYSASKYCPADTSGLRRLYVARVLTGRYTLGKSSMIATPPRNSDPTDCFDSLVNNQQNPTMFVIFHDDQAYPEYLITFN